MKKNSTKILVMLIAIILVLGTIMIFTKGLAFELKYQDNKKVELNIGKTFEEKDIREITQNVFGNQTVKIQAIEVYKDAVSITTTEITDEQKSELVTKINEKYGTELKAEDIKIEEQNHVRGREIIKPYIIPFTIATAIVLVCLVIRYNKLNSLEVLTQSIGIIVLAQLVLLCVMVITRMPIGRFTIPTVLTVYMLSTYICTTKFDTDLEKIKSENNTEKE